MSTTIAHGQPFSAPATRQMVRHAASTAQKTVKHARPSLLPIYVAFGVGLTCVGAYVSTQLSNEAATFDRFYEKQNSASVEEWRRRKFDGAVEDPRTSLYNILGWKRS